jgi:hypothetical protein
MQEARIVYLDCVMRYAARVDNAAWFMSLYQRALYTRFTDLAYEDTKHKEAALMCDVVSDDGPSIEQVGELANEGELRVLVRQASSEVRAVLSLLINAPTEILEVVTAQWRSHGSGQAYGSKLLCRMLSLPEDVNLLQRVREYFEPVEQ